MYAGQKLLESEAATAGRDGLYIGSFTNKEAVVGLLHGKAERRLLFHFRMPEIAVKRSYHAWSAAVHIRLYENSSPPSPPILL